MGGVEAAIAAVRAGRPDEAERLAAAALKSQPRDVQAAHVLGAARLMLGRPAEAVAPLAQACELSDEPANQTLLARALMLTGRAQEAVAPLRKAAAREPVYVLAAMELGKLLLELGERDEGEAAFKRAVAAEPRLAGMAGVMLAAAPNGRAFLHPDALKQFLGL